jgi:hypothetical protein
MYTKLSLLLRSSFLLLFASIFLAACNSSDTADTGADTVTGVDMGDVTLLLTDAPTSEYDEVNVVAESVSLIGEGPEAHIMQRPAKFNLLDLRNTFRRISKARCRVGIGMALLPSASSRDWNRIWSISMPVHSLR